MTSEKYWDDRATKRLTEAEKQSNDYIKRVKKIYTRANRDIKKQIANIYKNYSKETGLDIHTLKTLLSKDETDKFWKTLEGKGLRKYVQDNYKARINRLEQLQGQLYARAKEIYGEELETVYGHYRGVINETYNKTIYDTQIGTGYDFTFNKLDEKTINVLLNEKWYGKNYSQRIWGNTDIFANRISEILGGALISGKPYYKTANEVAEIFGVAQYYAERLIRTETNHFNAEAEALAYEELGVEKYVFVATLDNRTSEKCQNHDGKIYNFKDRKKGVNYPPLHPNCRSTTRGYLGEEEEKMLKRRAKNPITGEVEYIDNMNYEQWKKHINNRYGDGTLELSSKKQANLKKDTEQYDRYKSVLGNQNMPESIEKWQEMKYNNTQEYSKLKYNYNLKEHYNLAIEKGELSPLVNFDTYKNVDDMVKSELVGLTTTNGIEIKSYSKHFIDRVCGSIEQRRSGVEISNIKDIISNSNEIKHLEKSDVIRGKDIQVSINPATGNLIQTNPRVRRNKNDKN